MDLQLPEMPGNAVLAALRTDPQTRTIPVVVLSADATDQSREQLVEAGVDDYISKPFGIEDLLCRLDQVLANADHFR